MGDLTHMAATGADAPLFRLKMPRQWLNCMGEVYMPDIINHHRVFLQLYQTGTKEYLTGLVLVSICQEVVKSLLKKKASTGVHEPVLAMTVAQAYTLYLSFINYPIPSHLVWDNMMRNRFIRECAKFLQQPLSAVKYDMTKA